MNASPLREVVRDFEARWGRSADTELPLPAEVIRLNQYLFIELSPLPRATWDGHIQNAQIPFHVSPWCWAITFTGLQLRLGLRFAYLCRIFTAVNKVQFSISTPQFADTLTLCFYCTKESFFTFPNWCNAKATTAHKILKTRSAFTHLIYESIISRLSHLFHKYVHKQTNVVVSTTFI